MTTLILVASMHPSRSVKARGNRSRFDSEGHHRQMLCLLLSLLVTPVSYSF
jgi:hypothetical protein